MDADEPSRPPMPRRLRVALSTLLVVVFVGSLGYVLISGPPLPVTVGLIVIATVAAAVFAAYLVPNKLSPQAKRASTVTPIVLGLIATLLAPRINNAPTVPPPTPAPQSPSVTAQRTPIEPLTATLDIGGACENFVVPTQSLPSVPMGSELNAKWIYDHGGATSTRLATLTVQGTTKQTVTLHRLRVVQLKRKPVPSKVADLLPCGTPKPHAAPVRYFEVNLDDPPQVAPSPKAEKQSGSTEPPTKLPYQVSNTDAEVFVLIIKGHPCFCEWRLALDWTGVGTSGMETTVLDHGFGKIISDTSLDPERTQYTQKTDRTWNPPLPK